MDIKVGDVFVRHSDKRVWTVKKIDGFKVILESLNQDETVPLTQRMKIRFKEAKVLTVTDIHGLKNNYNRVEPTPHD